MRYPDPELDRRSCRLLRRLEPDPATAPHVQWIFAQRASRVPSSSWLFIVAGNLGVVAGIGTFVWPGITLYVVSILVAWYLIVFGIVHLVTALAGPEVAWWWTGLLLGAASCAGGVGGMLLGAIASHAADTGGSVGHLARGERDLRRLHPAPGRQASGAVGELITTRAGIAPTGGASRHCPRRGDHHRVAPAGQLRLC
jgi:hypothetical protein